MERAGLADAQDERIVQATRSLKHGPAARATAHHGDTVRPAKGQADFGADFVAVTDHHKMMGGFPEAQQFAGDAFFAQVEQRLVAGEVLFGRRQSEVAIADSLFGWLLAGHGV